MNMYLMWIKFNRHHMRLKHVEMLLLEIACAYERLRGDVLEQREGSDCTLLDLEIRRGDKQGEAIDGAVPCCVEFGLTFGIVLRDRDAHLQTHRQTFVFHCGCVKEDGYRPDARHSMGCTFLTLES